MPSAACARAQMAMLAVLLLVWGCGAAAEAPLPSCSSDLGCSLNGECSSGRCVCDSGWWSGALGACERLDLLPADLSAGYNHVGPGPPERGG
jgi:hypothetical protein